MYRRKTPVYALPFILAMCIVLTGLLSACSSTGGDVQQSGTAGDPNTMPPGTGNISFQIVMEQPSSGLQTRMLTPSFNSCVDYGIGTMAATVTSGTTTVASSSWSCSAHQGTITGVPAGSNYAVQLRALSSALPATTTWSGQATSITVSAGQTTNAGTIVMSYVGGDATAPTVTGIGPNSNPAISTNVPATDRINIVFSKSMAISTITSTNITLNNGSPVPGTVTYDSASRTATFIPSSTSSPLAYDTQHVLQVASCVGVSCIKDTAGHQLSTNYTFTFTTESAPTAAANAPSSLTARPGNGQVTLDWPAVNGATSYNVYYNTLSPATGGTQILGVRAPSVHLGLTNGTPYYYVVTAMNSFGESPASAETSTTPAAPAGNPLPPASLSVTYPSGGPYTVTWPTVSGMSYNLYWSTRPIYPDRTTADNVIRYVTPGTYVHTGVANGTTYCYIVTAMNANGESADSMQVCGPGAGSIDIFWP